MGKNIYFETYGIDISCEIASIFELDDTDKLNTIKMLLDNLEMWWCECISCKQEELEYNKLKEIIEKLDELIKMRKDYISTYNIDKGDE